MSTLPAEMVRFGSTYIQSGDWRETKSSTAYHHRDEWVLELLVRHLSVDVDTGQPTPVSWMRVIPANRVLDPANLTVDQVPQQNAKVEEPTRSLSVRY